MSVFAGHHHCAAKNWKNFNLFSRENCAWLIAILGAVCLHIGVSAYFWWQPSSELTLPPAAAPQVFDVSMVAAPVAPAMDVPIGPEQQQSSPASQQKSEPVPTEPEPELNFLPEMPSDFALQKNEQKKEDQPKKEEKPVEEVTPQPEQQDSSGDATGEQLIEETSAPLTMQAQASDTAAAPTEGALSERESQAKITWQSRLQAHLERRKRYPRSAQLRRQQGMPWVRFTMDRAGNVMDVALHRASGVAALDKEVVALVRRAAPLPVPPNDVTGNPLTMAVPVAFFVR